ncbi:hypothetical protein Dda_6262 [Drechslerella dactyloides]|uniref:Uncharacterized protein n=1 Tax=Drechslerella dactyloides TaxID=74499 RepID=A0AAD6IZR3_DREDA|nr:hypothetical protein Dda_6262 [Drechslerella dactyloides]
MPTLRSRLAACGRRLLWSSLIPILYLTDPGLAQSLTVTETESATRTIMVTEVVVTTSVTVLPSCGCPCSPFASGPVFTSTVNPSSVPDASAVALQLFVSPTPASEPESFFINVEGDSAVTSGDAFLFYLNDNGEYLDAADLSQFLFLYLTSALQGRSLEERQDIFGFYPIFYGDPFPGTTTETFFINSDGMVNLRYTWPNGTTNVYEFALCRVNGLIAAQIYMHEIDVPYPPQCYPAEVTQIPFSRLASLTSSTTTPTATGTSATQSDGTTSETSSRATNTNTGSSSSRTPGPTNTGTGTRTTGTGTTGTGNTGGPTLTPSSDTGTTGGPTDTMTGTSTVTIYTETIAPGESSTSLNTDGAGSPTLTLFMPYPSSLKILGYEGDDENPGLLDSYFNSAFVPIGGIINEGRIPYRLFKLTDEGWLMDPIEAPLNTDEDTWTGGGSLLPSPKYVYAHSDTTFGTLWTRVSSGDLAAVEADNGQLLTFTISEDGDLALQVSSNVTAGQGLWLCTEESTDVGYGDGNNPYCNYASITSIQARGFQTTIVDPSTGYAFVTAQTTTVINNGVGPTATVVTVLPRVVETVTSTITSGEAFQKTVGTGLADPTATVTFAQYVIVRTTTVWGRSVGISTTTYDADLPTAFIDVEVPYPTPAFIGDGFDHNLYVTGDPPILSVYGETQTNPPTDTWSLFYLEGDKLVLVVADTSNDEFYGTGPHYAYVRGADLKVYFLQDEPVFGYTLLTWQLNNETSPERQWLWLNADGAAIVGADRCLAICNNNGGADPGELIFYVNPPPIGCQAYGTDDPNSAFRFYWNATFS